ncbi:hypothetical protein P9B03_09285 [Metasolibacillus meyeri]|uniref:Rhoptry protein n=1 Tax=Metasolibacillus meyeri TaxID=1071052 RepID=A0AAW9NWG4_9BACL|nr:hypothetical protein [Metasolibacillus meyeri]MEC1178673.1 hypothetical protein [Metasolibacillus meyeri]
MNKKLFFTLGAAPIVMLAPAVVHGEETHTVAITGEKMVNGTLTATIEKLPAQSVVKGYQWYYAENIAGENSGGATYKPVIGATKSTLKVPVGAAGRSIFVEATTTDGTKYQSESVAINDLQLAITTPKLNDYAVPGEVVKVLGATVTDSAGAKLESGQVTYSYQWFYKVGESFTIIDGATSGTYTIAKDALDKDVKQIIVRVKATVGNAIIESDISNTLTISNESVNSMIDEIKEIFVNDYQYNFTTLAAFKAHLTDLNNKYQALSAAAKDSITNYSALKRAMTDVEAIEKLQETVNKSGEIEEKDKAKYLKDIEEAYNKLDLLQRSLDPQEALYTDIRNLLDNRTNEEFKEVRKINEAIQALLIYETSFAKYNAADIVSLQAKVEAIEQDIAALSQDAKAAVHNQSILQEAKQDIKKIQQFIKSFDKLSVADTPNKRVTTAKSIRTAYEKLTYKQSQLVTGEWIARLLQAESAEQQQIEWLNIEIASYVGNLGNRYPMNPSSTSWQSHVNYVNRLMLEYKGLTKNSATQIVGYDKLLTLQKDLKTALKVVQSIDAYQKLSTTNGVASNKLQSTYTIALKAYNKLTSLQQSLVYNVDEFLNNAPATSVDPGKQEPADKAAAEKLIADIEQLTNVKNYTFATFENAVTSASTIYKNLSSSARKYVTNYHILTAASKDLSGVNSFHKKVQAAREEMDVKKQAKKIESVQKAYDKLPANQQYLARQQYQDLLANRLVDNNAPNLVQLNNEIAAILINDMYVVSIERVNDLSAQFNKLSAADKKAITNSNLLKTAVSDAKKATTFIKQYEKSFATNPSTVIKAFAKLTTKQASLVNPTVRQAIINKEKELQSSDVVLTLIESINGLIVKGEYIANLESKVKDLRATYNSLSTSDKKAVKNYKKLTDAESDLKKVADVQALYVPADGDDKKRKAWKSAYSKLSKRLEVLYKQMYPSNL